MKISLQDLSHELKEYLLGYEEVFQIVRIVDPTEKAVFHQHSDHFLESISQNEIGEDEQQIYERDVIKEAYEKNDMFFKISTVKGLSYMVMAIPIRLEGRVVIIELTKKIYHDMISDLENYTFGLNELMSVTNAIAIKDSLTEVYKPVLASIQLINP